MNELRPLVRQLARLWEHAGVPVGRMMAEASLGADAIDAGEQRIVALEQQVLALARQLNEALAGLAAVVERLDQPDYRERR